MVINLLKDYKANILSIEFSKIKIDEWLVILEKDAIGINELYPKKRQENLGIQKIRKPTSPTEEIIERSEKIKETIKESIRLETLKIKESEKKIKLVDILLNSLSAEDRFILELKYKEKDKWHIITRKFNKEYRNQYDDYITVSGVKQKKDAIIQRLEILLEEHSSSKTVRK